MKNTKKIYKMRIVFCFSEKAKQGTNCFNAVRKMILTSGLPYEPAQVNANWPRFAYGPALANGQQAEREYVDIYLRERRSEAEVRAALQQVAPEGFNLLQVARVPYPLPSVQNLAAAVRYRVKGDFSPYISSGRKIEIWAGEDALPVPWPAKDGTVCRKTLKQVLLEAGTVSAEEVAFTLAVVKGKWIPPQWLVATWLGQKIPVESEAWVAQGFVFIRQGFYWQDSQGELHLI